MQNHSLRWCFIIFLTWSLIACKDTPSNVAIDNQLITAPNADMDSTILSIQPALAIVWIDQLRVRTNPTLESGVVVELQSGDTLYYLHEKTVREETITLRDSIFHRPWLKVKTKAGQIGWIFGGGVILSH